MKKVLIGAALILVSLGVAQKSEAQVRVNVNVNIGDQPRWRAPGYDYVEYYYLPDIETYYYVPRHQFIYLSNGRWVFSTSLPTRYNGYDLYSGRKIVVNRTNAYYYHNDYRRQYPGKHWNGDNGKHKGWYKNKKGRH